MKSLKLDCKYYTGDKPCVFHKEKGIKCDFCSHYIPVDKRVLIIKLGAPGDVLRTTPLLREIKRRDPSAYITWITEKASFPLLENNPYIDRLWDYSIDTLSRLQVEDFDLVLSLDNAGDCATIASIARGRKKLGYGLNTKGMVVPFSPESEEWLEMAVFDDVKKANRRTYQNIIFNICGYKFDPAIHEIVLNLKEEDVMFARKFARSNSIQDTDLIVGVNVGAGKRWPMKRWTVEGFAGLIEKLINGINIKVVLLCGHEEVEIANAIKSIVKTKGLDVIDAGCHNPLRNFMAIVDLCDVVVTADTLAMHIAIGLKKYVVALFGPTSAAEIELYNRGKKIVADKECICCYRQKCEVTPYCIESITVNEVLEAVKECIESCCSNSAKVLQSFYG